MSVAVITTVQPPTPQMKRLGRKVEHLIVIGDSKGPEYYLDGSDFLPLDSQRDLPFTLAGELPVASYSRKNLGYLRAMHAGAKCIYETDDDNLVSEDWSWRVLTVVARRLGGKGWCNVYRAFSEAVIWPRGLPLDQVGSTGHYSGLITVDSPVQQVLVDGDPDVDAVFRMLPQSNPGFLFSRCHSVALDYGTWCPFNSQNTHWWPEAYPLMYLPSTCSFRMTDIWRSFVAQRCLWKAGRRVVFHAPDAVQDRNQHDLRKDLEDELEGMRYNHAIRECLDGLVLGNIIVDNLFLCYEALHRLGVFKAEELRLLKLWMRDLP